MFSVFCTHAGPLQVTLQNVPTYFMPKNATGIVKVRQTRYRIDPDTIYNNLLQDDLRVVRALPFP